MIDQYFSAPKTLRRLRDGPARRVQPDVIRPFERGHLRDGNAGLQLGCADHYRPERAAEGRE